LDAGKMGAMKKQKKSAKHANLIPKIQLNYDVL
jgi:hypothetical protein